MLYFSYGSFSFLFWCLVSSVSSISSVTLFINPLMTNGFTHHYHLGKPTFILGYKECFQFLFHFFIKFLQPNRMAPDGMLRSAASHLRLYCLAMSHIKDTGLIKISVLFLLYELSLV